MKTKYIKVAVSERLPELRGYYATNLGDSVLYTPHNDWWESNNDIVFPEYWFEEVEGHEEEMRGMLEKVLKINTHHNFNGHLINEQIEELLTKLKTKES